MRLLQLLMEDRIRFLMDKYMWLLWMKKAGWGGMPEPSVMANPVAQNDAKQGFNDFLHIDPTRDKKYVQWLIRLFLKDGMRYDDFGKARRYLERFEELKPKLEPAQRDINRFRTLADLYTQVIQPNEETDATSNRQLQAALDKELKKGVRLVYKGPEGAVYQPENEDAACYLGRGTQWCTASTQSENYFDDYNNEGPLYVIITPDGRKVQFHFESGQFMDETDTRIPVWAPKYKSIRGEPLADVDEFSLEHNYQWLRKIPELAEAGRNNAALWMFENPDEQTQLDAIMKDPFLIERIRNPGQAVQMAAVSRSNGKAFSKIKRPTPLVQKEALKRDPENIQWIKKPSEELQMMAVVGNASCLRFISNPTPAVVHKAVLESPYAIQYVDKPGPDLQMLALHRVGDVHNIFRSIPREHLADEAKWYVLKYDPRMIKFFDSSTEEMQEYAVKRDIETAEYIKGITPKVLEFYTTWIKNNPTQVWWTGPISKKVLRHRSIDTRSQGYKDIIAGVTKGTAP